MRHVVVAALLAAAVGTVALAQGREQNGGQEGALARFSSEVQLVEVYATVTDRTGEPVTGLRQSDFEVYENDEPQSIAAFAAGEFPLTVALGVDRSWSMAGKPLALAKQASRSFLNQLKPADRSMVLAISSSADVIAWLSTDRAAQAQAIAALDPWSTTALRDATIAALDRLEPEPGRQALVLFSDGNDRYSTASESEVLARARRSHALIYPITFGRSRPSLLAEMAVATGGRSFLLADPTELDKTLSTIAKELRYQYLIGYAPMNSSRDGAVPEWRAIRVGLKNHPALRVRARDGYNQPFALQ